IVGYLSPYSSSHRVRHRAPRAPAATRNVVVQERPFRHEVQGNAVVILQQRQSVRVGKRLDIVPRGPVDYSYGDLATNLEGELDIDRGRPTGHDADRAARLHEVFVPGPTVAQLEKAHVVPPWRDVVETVETIVIRLCDQTQVVYEHDYPGCCF